MSQILNFKNEYSGISAQKAEKNLGMYGLNSSYAEDEYAPKIAKRLINPRIFIMLAAAALSAVNSDIVGFSVMLVLTAVYIAAVYFLEVRLHEKNSALKRLSGIKFRVVRDGELVLVRKEYLVPDDIIVLHGGERVPADAVLLEGEDIVVDESAIDGDATPVIKHVDSESKAFPKLNCIYKNTLLLRGNLVAKIIATGEDVAVGEKNIREKPTDFEHAVNKVTPFMNAAAIVMLFVCGLLCFVETNGTPDLSLSDAVIRAVLSGTGFALCFTPPMIAQLVRYYYIKGALRLSKKHALVKSLQVFEKMNALTCVCVEKTGTITKNHLEIADEYTRNPAMFTNVSVLACEKNPTTAIDSAILFNATFSGTDVKDLQSNKLLASYPFTERNKMAGNLWDINGTRLLCVKGSPDVIFTLCDISNEEMHYILYKQNEFSKNGQQVLAVAYTALTEDEEIPESLFSVKLSYIGLLSFTNQTKDTIPYAIKSCYKAGVNVIMTTGDSEETAVAIARKIGLKEGRAITGEMLKEAEISGEKPDLDDVNIFARVTPEQRRSIIKMLRESGEIVAMAGDDLEDVEVLSEADVGIAVTSGACPAANETCDLLMSDENFIAVVDAVKESRQVHLNMKRCISVGVTAMLSLAVIALISLINGANLFTPALSTLLTLFVIPICAMFFIDDTADLKSDFISSGFIGRGKINKTFFPKAILQSAMLFIGILIYYCLSLALDVTVQRSIVFMMFSLGLVVQSLTMLSEKLTVAEIIREKKCSFAFLAAGVQTLLTLILVFVPFVNSAFTLAAPDFAVTIIALIITLVFNGWPELMKYIRNRA